MKKYLVLTGFLTFALFVWAQNPLEELAFYQKQAQDASKQTQQELVNNLHSWLEANAALPQASKALILKANLEKNLKDYPDFLITLLRYKYEFSPVEKTNVQSVLKDSVKDFPKNEQETYNELINRRVPQADLPSRLDTFLALATKANLKDTYQPLLKEYNTFFKRFKDYEELDRLELMLGDLHRNNKNPYGALMQYQKVWEVYPDTKYKAASLRMQGDVYASNLKDYEKAKSIYEQVLNDFPTSMERPTAYYHLAVMEESQKEYNEAISHLGFAAKLYKEQGDTDALYDVLLFKAEIQEKKLKDYEGAAQTLKEIAALFKNNEQKYIQTQLRLADLYTSKLKDSTAQRKAYEDIIRAYPNSKQADRAVFEVATLAKEAGEYQMAAAYLERLIVNNPSSEYAGKAQRQLNSINKKIAKNK
ncbi:MAG: tetratricopeptide repeat protein [Elusimicrobiaceae bacterium]|nr:tetratricopeptide repeat protein [Elusimicrobiaceae bacterium]